jgi:phosphate transport system substrate-binding protein
MDRLACLCLLAASLFAPTVAAVETLRVHGSNTIGATLAPALAEAWLQARGYERIERVDTATNEIVLHARGSDAPLDIELRAHGSSTGFDDLIAGRADVAMASRPVSADELARSTALGALDTPQQEAVIALDGIALIVHPSNPVRELDLGQLRAVFTGRVRDWSALGAGRGPIVLHARDDKSGTWDTFRSLVLGDTALHPGAMRHESTRELVAAVMAEPRAIGFAGLGAIDGARPLAISDGGHALAPAASAVAVEDYALSRRLFLYCSASAAPRVRDFIEFVQSPAGQRVVEAEGFIAQQIRPYVGATRQDTPREYRELVRDAERLSLNFRFGSGSRMLDGKMLRDATRLAAFMREPQNRGRPLLLMGFADAGEASPYMALTLSNDRVDLVSRLLQERGLDTARARGMGGAAPVASNDSLSGRLRNRRVEVWLGHGPDAAVAGGRHAGGLAD